MLRVRTQLDGFQGGPGLMTHYFTVPSEDVASATRVSGYVRSAFVEKWRSFWPNGVSAQVQSEVASINPTSGALLGILTVAPIAVAPGSGGASKAPAAIAALQQLRTNVFLNGRNIRGRTFVSPLAATAVDSDGRASAAVQSTLANSLGELNLLLQAGDAWVVWHRPVLGVGGSAAPIVAVTAPFILSVLRSRRD